MVAKRRQQLAEFLATYPLHAVERRLNRFQQRHLALESVLDGGRTIGGVSAE